MRSLLKGKKGLSTVVTTLIILVVSVLLATVVTYYAINVTTSRVQQENLYLSKSHIWVNITGTAWAEAGICLVNTGGRDVVLDKITVRSQECNWSNAYYWTTNNVTISKDLRVTPTELSGPSFNITVQDSTQTFKQGSSSSDLTLKSGYTMVLYIMKPDSISFNDIGTSASITVHTANAMWSQECIVEAAQ